MSNQKKEEKMKKLILSLGLLVAGSSIANIQFLQDCNEQAGIGLTEKQIQTLAGCLKGKMKTKIAEIKEEITERLGEAGKNLRSAFGEKAGEAGARLTGLSAGLSGDQE